MTDYIKAYEDAASPYHREAVEVAEDFATDRVWMDHGDVPRWSSNDQIPPQEILELWAHMGYPFAVELTQEVQEREQAAFLAEYRATWAAVTDEERLEARAAHGPGVELVDVVTGRR